jgi:TP901 family phage tail tape measure protein
MFVADLGIRVGTDGVKRAQTELDRLRRKGGETEQAMGGLTRGMARLAGGVLAFGTAVGGIQLASQFVTQGRAVSKNLAEVSTLLNGTAQEMEFLTSKSQEFVRSFGGDSAQQLQGFYNTISAGAGSVEEAAVTMEQANKLAKGGVTDIGTAVDGLTSVMNAYGDNVEGAAAVSDAMFVAMKAGKTTIGELSSSIGKVAPLAVSAGVEFDELVGSIAALTKGGIQTTEAVTGVRAILAAVTKPSQEAQKLAAKLGLEFNSASLKAKGFAGFMEDVKAKTGGSTDAMAMLFGGVEAIVPALALAGQAGEDLNVILGDMETKAGATDVAVEKIAQSLDDRLNVQLARFTIFAEQAGTALLTGLVVALETTEVASQFVGDNLDIIGAAAVGLAATQIPALVSGLAGLRGGMVLVTGAARAMAVAMTLAGGPIGIIVGLLAGGAAYWLLFRDNTDEAITSIYDAEAGTNALNTALGVFYQTGAPSAGKAAIDLANSNYKLAQSALAAAEAELAKRQALRDTAADISSSNPLLEGNAPSYVEEELDRAERDVQKIRDAVEQARRERDRAARAVTGSGFGGVTQLDPIDVPGVDAGTEAIQQRVAEILKALQDTGAAAGSGSGGAASGMNELADAAKRVFEDTRTPLEKYNTAMAELNMLLEKGAISQDTFNRASKVLAEDLKKAQEETDGFADKLDGVAESLTDIILEAKSAGDVVEDMLRRIGRALISSGIKMGLSQIADGLKGLGGGKSSGLGSFVGMVLESFAGGGRTRKGSRTGGVDGKGGYPAIVHPDETIIDHRAGQQVAAPAPSVFAPTIHADGADAGAIARLERTITELYRDFDQKVWNANKRASRTGRDKQWS